MAGIKETKDVLAFVLNLTEGMAVSLADDGDVGWDDAVNFIDAVKSIPSAFAGIGEVPQELGDLSEREIEELVKFVEDNFDIPQENIKDMISRALNLGLDIHDYVSDLMDIFKEEVEEDENP